MAKDRKNQTNQTATDSTVADDSTKVAAEGTADEGANEGAETATDAEGKPVTATGKPSKKGQPVPIGKRRALGLAVRGLMAEIANGTASAGVTGVEGQEDVPASPAYLAAQEALGKNKYTELRPQAERLAEIQTKLQEAIANGDGTAISKLGKELNRVKMGL